MEGDLSNHTFYKLANHQIRQATQNKRLGISLMITKTFYLPWFVLFNDTWSQ